MLDKDVNNKIEPKAFYGGIYKSHKKSWFERVYIKGSYGDSLLNKDPRIGSEQVVILQMVICGDMQVIAEIVRQKDYEDTV